MTKNENKVIPTPFDIRFSLNRKQTAFTMAERGQISDDQFMTFWEREDSGEAMIEEREACTSLLNEGSTDPDVSPAYRLRQLAVKLPRDHQHLLK